MVFGDIKGHIGIHIYMLYVYTHAWKPPLKTRALPGKGSGTLSNLRTFEIGWPFVRGRRGVGNIFLDASSQTT